MYFTKTVTAENGSVLSYHRITKAEFSSDLETLRVFVASWPSKASFDAGYAAVWPWFVATPVGDLDLTGGMAGALASAVTGSPFLTGADVTPD